MTCLQNIARRLRGFLADEDGTAGLEFVATSPLILGVLVFTAEYGQALRTRMVLDSAVQDAARFLARSPVDNATTVPGTPLISFYPATLTEAEQIIEERIGQPVGFSATAVTIDPTGFRTPFYRISVTATTAVDLPLLSLFNIFREDPSDGDIILSDGESSVTGPVPLRFSLRSEQLVRWVGGAQPGEASCLLADRYQGLCP